MLPHKLLRLFDPRLPLSGIPDLDITGVCEDSRRVKPGCLFVARPGTKTDGPRYVVDATAAGAVAVVTQQKHFDSRLPQIIVKDTARAASVLANLFHGSPASQMY